MNNLKEYFRIASRNMKTRSLRSWLTILGIVIGVFLIIGLLALSEGIKSTVEDQLTSLGSEMVMVVPGDMSNPIAMFAGGIKLEKEDIGAIERTRGVDAVLSVGYQSTVVRYEDEGKSVFLTALDWAESRSILENFQGWTLQDGEWPVPGKREILVGNLVTKNLFKKNVKVNKEITIRGRRFKVVGALNSLGNKQDDTAIYIDMDLFYDITGEKKGSAAMAMVKVREGGDVDKIAERIKESLQETRKRRAGTDEADFSVITSEKMGDIANNILGAIQVAIIGFASIAIIVGGIGIMNTMFTSVRERTREIGIMKAIGATNSAVLAIFLIEAGIIGFAGGIGGTILGALFARIIEAYGQISPVFYLNASVTPGLVIFGLTFSFLVGCFSGFFPARAASKLKPVEALRGYE